MASITLTACCQVEFCLSIINVFWSSFFFVRTGEPTEHAELNARYASNFSFTVFLVKLTSTSQLSIFHIHRSLKKIMGKWKLVMENLPRECFYFPGPDHSLVHELLKGPGHNACVYPELDRVQGVFTRSLFFSWSLFGEVEIWLILGINNVVNPC